MNDYNIKELYEEMEMELIDSMKRNLGRHLIEEEEIGFEYPQWQAIKLKELKRYQRENAKIIGSYTKGLDKKISEHLQSELKQGSINSIKQYNKLTGSKKKPSKIMNNSFFKTNDRKVRALINSVNNDLNKANVSALRMINDEYRQIIFKSAFFVANGVKTEKQAINMAISEISQKKATMLACDEVSKTFLAGGLNCIEYKDGRRVNIASYAEMAVRTASLRAHLMGEGDFRKSIGRTLVKVTTHGGACKLCTKWQGKVLVDDVYSGGEPDGKHQLLSEAMEQGFLHPNCRHGLATYYPELEGISYDKDEGDEFLPDELREHYNYYDRLGKSWNRRNHGFLDSNNRMDAKNHYLACEKKKEEIIRINDDNNIIINQKIKNISDEVYESFQNNKYENLAIVNSKTNKKIGKISNIKSSSSVDYSDEQKNKMKKYHRQLYAIHNHPGNHTFSLEDLYEIFNNDSLCGIIVRTDEYNYYFIPKENDLDITKDHIREFKKWFETRLGDVNDEMLIKYPSKSNNELQHLSFEKIFNKLGWKYGREKV